MTKKAKETEKTPSWDDFSEENLLGSDMEDQEDTSSEDEEEEDDEEGPKSDDQEEEDEEESKPEKKDKKEKKEKKKEAPEKKSKTKPEPAPSEDEEEEEEVEETEEEEEDEEQEEGDQDSLKFFQEVDKLTGFEVEVDYGTTDPATPQGFALRDKAIYDKAMDDFLAEIEANYPSAHKALQHAFNGGDPADLFKVVASRDYSKVQIGDKDEALATEILKEYYHSKGIKSEKRIAALIEGAQDSDEGLVTEAKAVLQELQAEQEEKRNQVLQSQSQKAAERKKQDQIMIAAMDEVLETGALGSFKLGSRQETAEFKEFILKNMRRTDDGKYAITSIIDSNNLTQQLQYQYFQFKKGDLGKLIQIKADTANASKLKMKLKAEQGKQKKGSQGAETKTQQSLRDYDV